MTVCSCKQLISFFGLPIAFVFSLVQPARSQIESSGRLGTSINGGTGSQSCSSGVCSISGGTDSGSNKFHHFTLFDANSAVSAISEVTLETDLQTNIILGIASSSNGFNLNVPLILDSSANLFIVSPEGISLSTGASFSNVIDLNLTNLSVLPIGTGLFSINSSLDEVHLLDDLPVLSRDTYSLSSFAPSIHIHDVTLSVDDSLYVYANSDLVLSNTILNSPSAFDVGGVLTVLDSSLDNNASISFYAESDLTIWESSLDNNLSVFLHNEGDLGIYYSTIEDNSDVHVDSGNTLTIYDSVLDNNSLIALYSESNIDMFYTKIDENSYLSLDVGDSLNLNISDTTSPSDAGVSISDNTMVTIETQGDFNLVNSSLDNNGFLYVDVGHDLHADSIPSQFFSGATFDGNEILSLIAIGDINIYDSSISINSMIDIDSGGDIVFSGSDLNGNLPYTNAQYVSDFDSVDALDVFTIDAVGTIQIFDSSIDFNGPFEITSSASDIIISNSDFLANLYPYLESVIGDILISGSLLSGNAFIDAYSFGDAFVFDTSVVGNDIVIGAEQGDAVIANSDLSDNATVTSSTEGDAVVFDSNVDNNVLDIVSGSGDALIFESDVIGSDVFALSTEGDVSILGSNVDEGVFQAAALTGNIDLLSSEFINNQELSFVADFDVVISDSSVAGSELVFIDVGNDVMIDSSDVSGSDVFIVDAGNDVLIESSNISENNDVFVDSGNELIIGSSGDDDGGFVGVNSDNEVQSLSQESATSNDASSETSSGESDNQSNTASDANSESSADSDSSEQERGNTSLSSDASNDESSEPRLGDLNPADPGEFTASSFQISPLDTTSLVSNLRDTIDTNASEVLSALGLDEISPTPASELTPASISQSLNNARQIYQSLGFSILNSSASKVANGSSSRGGLLSSRLVDSSFNPAFLNISFTKNSDLGLGDTPKGFIDLTLITSEGTLIGSRTELLVSELSMLLRGFYSKLTSQRSLDPSLDSSEASRLYSLFLEPLQDVISTEKITTLLVSSDRGLQAIPFSALAKKGEFAVQNLSFSLTPSLSLTDLSVSFASSKIDDILIMGSTYFSGLAPLPFVDQEVKNIGQYYGAQSVLGDQFTSVRILSDLRSSSQPLIHLATHADFKKGRPDQSMIYTSDGSISLESFKSIRRARKSNPVDLFVLSACRSALGDSDSEMGLAGMALQAGAKSAIGSLWYVDDVATSAFFSQFYRHLSRGVTKSTALNQTQRDFALGSIRIQGTDVVVGSGDVLLSGLSTSQKYNYPRDFRHPFFWSGFVLLGTPW